LLVAARRGLRAAAHKNRVAPRNPPALRGSRLRMPPTHSDEGIRAAKGDPDAAPDVAVLVLSQYIELR
jgi:hypothetical protein